MSFRASLAVLAGFFLLSAAFLALLVLSGALPMWMGLVFAVPIMLGVLSLYPISIIWVYRDANSRGKPGWAVALLVAFAYWPFGLLAWVIFRPEKPQGYRNLGAASFAGTPGQA